MGLFLSNWKLADSGMSTSFRVGASTLGCAKIGIESVRNRFGETLVTAHVTP